MVGVGPDDAAIRNVGGGVIVLGSRKPLRILGHRRNDVVEHFVVGAVHLDPFFCPKVKTGVVRSEQFAIVIRPLIGECLRANQRVD